MHEDRRNRAPEQGDSRRDMAGRAFTWACQQPAPRCAPFAGQTQVPLAGSTNNLLGVLSGGKARLSSF